MLVEDNPIDAALAIREIRTGEICFDIRVVSTLHEYIKALEEFGPDLVISDYILPDFNGMRVINLALERDELLPVIIITGSINEETAVKCIKAGAQDYIFKENLKRLPYAIADALELRRNIAEKNNAEAALKESQGNLEMFFQQSLDGFFFMMLEKPVFWNDDVNKDEVLDYIYHNQKVTKINQAMLDQYRAKPEDMLNMTAADFFAHDPVQGMRVWRQFLDDGHLIIDTEERRMDGTSMWTEGEYRCMYDPEGRFTGHFGLQRDVTEKRLNEQRVIESEERYRLLIDHIGEGIALVNPDEVVTMANPAADEIFGVDVGDLVGRSLTIFTDSSQSDLIRKQTIKRKSGETNAYELRIKRFDGSTRDLLVTAVPQFDKGKIFMGTFGVFRDITETKRVQDSIKKQLVALTQPLDDPRGISFSTLFNLEDIQSIQDKFASATGVASIITLPDGTPLTQPTNFRRLCKDLIRNTSKGLSNCFNSDSVIGQTVNAGPVVQRCLSSGLWDAGASIMVGGKHVANWLIGQIRNEAQNIGDMVFYADEIGVDREEYRKAFEEVPVMTEEQFRKVADALYTIANELSLKAYQNIQQARFILEKQETEAALRDSELKYRTLVQYSSDPIFSFNPDLSYRFVNEAFAREFGKPPEQIMGKTPFEIFTDEEAQRRLNVVREVFKTGEHGRIDVKVLTANGEMKFFTTMVDPVKDKAGEVLWVSCISKNITDIKLAEEELIKAKEKAEESDRLKSAFLANMSHEIRTPMNSIIGFAELLTEEEVSPEERKKYAGLIERGSEQLLSLINDIIDVSKIEAGQLTLSPVRVEIFELIEEIYQMFLAIKVRMQKDQVHLLMDMSEMEPNTVIHIDRNRLRQVLTNLVHNALKFTDSGSIIFGCKNTNDNEIRFFVKDTGIGISPKKQELIFKRFRQVEESTGRTSRGTGLGLAISKNLVHLMGGEIGVISELGEGSEFWFSVGRGVSR